MKLSVLDQSVALSGHGEDAAIRDTLELAQHGDRKSTRLNSSHSS